MEDFLKTCSGSQEADGSTYVAVVMEEPNNKLTEDGGKALPKLLYVAYSYPPVGGSGVQRSSKLVKYLSRIGHQVSVLSVTSAPGRPVDRTLLSDIEPSIEVLRTEYKSGRVMASGLHLARSLSRRMGAKRVHSDPKTADNKQGASRWQSGAQGLLSVASEAFLAAYRGIVVPDDRRGWRRIATAKVLSQLKQGKWDAVVTTSSPLTAHLIGLDLKRATNIPWVADFRDAWLSNPFLHLPALTRGRHAALEQQVINEADAVVSVSEPISKDFRMRYKDHKDKFITITNGYDPEDFDLGASSSDSGPYRDNRPFSICYVGTLCGGRSPAPFLDAVSAMFQEGVLNPDSVSILFVGRVAVEHKYCLSAFQERHPGVLETQGYLEHDRAIDIMTHSCCNLLLISLRGGAGTNGVATGKIYEYLAANRPILAVVQDGIAADIVRATEAGVVARPDNPSEIKEAILKCRRWSENGGFSPKENVIGTYSRENQAKELSNLIQSLRNDTPRKGGTLE